MGKKTAEKKCGAATTGPIRRAFDADNKGAGRQCRPGGDPTGPATRKEGMVQNPCMPGYSWLTVNGPLAKKAK